MQAEHIEGWMEEASKADAAAEKLAKEAEEANGRPEKEDMEAERGAVTEKDLKNWEKVVALVRMAFREGRLA